jgi:hypothetical protein
MKTRLDALIAEIAQILDVNLLRHDPELATLPRSQRLHFIMVRLLSLDIARAEKSGGRKVQRWRPSRRLESNYGVKQHGIPDEFERIEAPIAISTLAEKFAELLLSNNGAVEEVASYVLRRFAMYKVGLLEFHGKTDGLCQFERSARRIDVVDEDGHTTDFVDKYLA